MRTLLLQLGNKVVDAHAFQIRLRPAQIAGNYRKLLLRRKRRHVPFAAVGQRSNDGVTAVDRAQHRRHRFHLTNVKKIQQKSCSDVVGKKTQRDLRQGYIARDIIKNSSSLARTDGTVSLAFGNQPLHYRVGIALDNEKRNVQSDEIFRQHVGGKSWLLLIQVHGQKVKAHRRALLQIQKQIQQRVTVLSSGEADHDAIAICDHVKIRNRFAHAAQQTDFYFAFQEHWLSQNATRPAMVTTTGGGA